AIAMGRFIGVVDPDSIGPGEGRAAITVVGSMGLLSGVVFAILLVLSERDRAALDVSPLRGALWGFLGTTAVQLGYLDHGDAGLVANIGMGLAFSAFGGVIGVA
ncbi:MAG TPA: hypothetical protein VFV34_03340, partial [Blastocatellia bacterium]|nr:hypothetical protein [Blastocatellia bacterium]